MSRDPNYNDLKNFEKNYSDEGLTQKLLKFAIIAGKHVVYRCLLLKYALFSNNTPAVYKGLIYGALGYFISPLDLVPDVIPGLGFVDDLAAITLVITTLCSSNCIDEKDRTKAKKEIKKYLNDCDTSDLDDF